MPKCSRCGQIVPHMWGDICNKCRDEEEFMRIMMRSKMEYPNNFAKENKTEIGTAVDAKANDIKELSTAEKLLWLLCDNIKEVDVEAVFEHGYECAFFCIKFVDSKSGNIIETFVCGNIDSFCQTQEDVIEEAYDFATKELI